MRLFTVGREHLVVQERVVAQQALISLFPGVVDLMLSSILGEGKDFVTVVAGVLLFPRVSVEVTPETGQTDRQTEAF